MALKEFQDLCLNLIATIATDNTMEGWGGLGGSKSGPLCALLWRILTWCSRKNSQARHIYASTTQPVTAVRVLFSPMVSRWSSRQRKKVCLDCISQTIMCRKLILGRDIGWGCRCARSWCDLYLTFDLGALTITSCPGYISEIVRCRKLIHGRDIR